MEKNSNLVKMSFLKGLKVSFDSILDNFKSFMFFSVLCALFSSCLTLIAKIKEDSLFLFAIYVVLFLLTVSFFINCWFKVLNKESKIKVILKSILIKDVFRTLAFVLANIVAWCVIVGSSLFLYNRVATLGFGLEILIYLGLSIIVILCFLFLLNFVVFICFLKKEKCLIFRNHFFALYDNVNQIIGWTFFLFIMFFVLSREVSSIFILPTFFVSIINMWCFYFCLAFYISILNYQYEKIFLDKN